MGILELVVGGDVDVVGGMGVTGSSAHVCGDGAQGEFLYSETGEADGEVDLCALLWGEGGVQ